MYLILRDGTRICRIARISADFFWDFLGKRKGARKHTHAVAEMVVEAPGAICGNPRYPLNPHSFKWAHP